MGRSTQLSLKAQAPPADTTIVDPGDRLANALDDVLTALPDGFIVADDGVGAHLVVGPPGAFVLMALPADRRARDDAAQRVHVIAQTTRAELGEHLAWVPFLDALLISTGALLRGADVTVAPVDLLGAVLRDGPEQIDRATLHVVARAIARGRLGDWRPRPAPGVRGHPATDGRIGLCQVPLPPRAASAR
jgi:hypothetical protein